jgi:hypothetical protein
MLTPVNDKLEQFNFGLSDPDCQLTIEPDSFSEVQYQTVRYLSVTNTHLTYEQLLLDFANKFKKLETINIEENNIEELNRKDFQHFNYLKLKVSKNPYKCHCKTLITLNNLRHNISDFDHIKCFSGQDQFLTIDKALRVFKCIPMELTTVIALTFGTLLVILIIFIIMYKLRIVCYNHRLLHKLFPNESLDDNYDLKYHAFISYSEKDQTIASSIYNKLNDGTLRRIYDTAIDEVTWEPGTVKATNIEDSIQMSMRTIALVSEDYFNDDYCQQAFNVAKRHPSR